MKKMRVNFLNKSKIDLHSKYLTEDNLVDIAQKEFLKQQEQFLQLQNHLRAFIKGIIDITDTIDNMYSCFKGIYEPSWVGSINFNKICQESVNILRQFIADFKCNITKAVNEYGQDFPDIKRSIERRNKKMIELSKQRRIYENYRNGKKVDEIKIKNAKIELDNIDEDYQNQNNKLKECLPTFCDKRIAVYADLWTKLFDAEGAMFSFLYESRKNQLIVLSKLSDMAQSEKYSIKTQINMGKFNDTNLLSTKAYAKSAMSLMSGDLHTSAQPINSVYAIIPENELNITDDSTLNRAKSYQINRRPSPIVSDASLNNIFTSPSGKVTLTKRISFSSNSQLSAKSDKVVSVIPKSKIKMKQSSVNVVKESSDIDDNDGDHGIYATIQKTGEKSSVTNGKKSCKVGFDNVITNIASATKNGSAFFYKVMATFDYFAQDEDELTLSKSDILLVLPWNNEEEMEEEGWLFGENVITKKKGLFPENHTTRLT